MNHYLMITQFIKWRDAMTNFRKISLLSVILSSIAGNVLANEVTNFAFPSERSIKKINLTNMLEPNNNHYAFQHMQEFSPSTDIRKDQMPVFPLKNSDKILDDFKYTYVNPKSKQATEKTLKTMLKETNTDAFIVMKDGKIVTEQYFNGQNSQTRHQMMSVTKSFFGLIAASLVAEGQLDSKKKVIDYIPELKGSAYGDATVEQVMDMTVGIKYSEDYLDPNAEVVSYMRSLGLGTLKIDPDYGIRNFITTLKKQGQHGDKFQYATVNTDVMCWLMERATKKPASELLYQRLWSKMGMERDAFVLVDSQGVSSCGGGLNATARDLARFGQLILQKGAFNNQQLISAQAISSIEAGGDKKAFAKSEDGKSNYFPPTASYKNQFWSFGEAFSAIGIYGQWIYINPKQNVVIVKQSSLPKPDDSELTAYHYKTFEEIVKALK